MTGASIVVIEDEPEICRFLKAVFESNDFHAKFANSAKEGIKTISLYPPEIIILDLGLPDKDGFELIKNIREWSKVPIIVLSARSKEEDKVMSLELGADDYLTKPFGTAELLARIKVALRRSSATPSSPIFESGEFKIDFEKRQVSINGKEIRLTKIEYKLLSVLVKNAGKVLTHLQLLKEVWGRNSNENSHYLRIYTQHLRDKLGDDPLNPKYIFTEVGVGYKFRSC